MVCYLTKRAFIIIPQLQIWMNDRLLVPLKDWNSLHFFDAFKKTKLSVAQFLFQIIWAQILHVILEKNTQNQMIIIQQIWLFISFTLTVVNKKTKIQKYEIRDTYLCNWGSFLGKWHGKCVIFPWWPQRYDPSQVVNMWQGCVILQSPVPLLAKVKL